MNTIMDQKRKRSSNFSKEEELSLVENIEKFKNIVECKTTNKLSSTEKENAWNNILTNFNSQNVGTRTLEQIRAKYDNLKTKVRKEVAGKKTHIKGTGGGEPMTMELNPVSEAVLRIINLKTVVGLNNEMDSDFPQVAAVNDFENINADPEMNPETIPIFIAEELTEEIQLNFSNHDEASTSSSIKSTAILKETTPTCKKQESWATYVPRKLKQKRNPKLRPLELTPVGEIKHGYYKRKLELLEKREEEESLERKKRVDREVEEHEKKMKLIDLDIKLKTQQLENNYY